MWKEDERIDVGRWMWGACVLRRQQATPCTPLECSGHPTTQVPRYLGT